MIDPRRNRVRPLGLLDGILVVAGFAVWLAAIRGYSAAWENIKSTWFYFADLTIVRAAKYPGAYFLAVASLTLLVLRLRGPRPSLRRLWRQPGFVASAGAVLGMLISAAGALMRWATEIDSHHPWPGEAVSVFLLIRPFGGPGVFGAWFALVLAGRWRSEPGAIDRLGRVVGALWLLQFALSEVPTTPWLIALNRWWFP